MALAAAGARAKDPKYGNWLDLYVTLRAPLPPPVDGVLGKTYSMRARAASDGVPEPIYAGIVWLEEGQDEPTPDVGFSAEDGVLPPPPPPSRRR